MNENVCHPLFFALVFCFSLTILVWIYECVAGVKAQYTLCRAYVRTQNYFAVRPHCYG